MIVDTFTDKILARSSNWYTNFYVEMTEGPKVIYSVDYDYDDDKCAYGLFDTYDYQAWAKYRDTILDRVAAIKKAWGWFIEQATLATTEQAWDLLKPSCSQFFSFLMRHGVHYMDMDGTFKADKIYDILKRGEELIKQDIAIDLSLDKCLSAEDKRYAIEFTFRGVE
jgi:hypothetical protein